MTHLVLRDRRERILDTDTIEQNVKYFDFQLNIIHSHCKITATKSNTTEHYNYKH
jgi:hypothetical protein